MSQDCQNAPKATVVWNRNNHRRPCHSDSASAPIRARDQNVPNATQNSLCRAVNRRRGPCACRASNCRRRATFSRTRSSREPKALTIHPRRCGSDTIMARILSENSESSFAPSHSFCECTTFWRDIGLVKEDREVSDEPFSGPCAK